MVPDEVNLFAAFRFALSYPDERHVDYFAGMGPRKELSELRSLYVGLFEAGMPQPKCPMLESFYVATRPAPEVVLENKLFYKHFGLQTRSQAAPDSLLAQLEFLAWLDHCLSSGNPDRESLERGRADFVARHVAHWVPKAAALLDEQDAPYAELLALLADAVNGEEAG